MSDRVLAGGVQTYGPDRLAGSCTCGWQGEPRVYAAQAQRDVEAHMICYEHLPETELKEHSMTPPSPVSTDPLEALHDAVTLEGLTKAMDEGRIADGALVALQQVRELVDAARDATDAAQMADPKDIVLSRQRLRRALTPFITQGHREGTEDK